MLTNVHQTLNSLLQSSTIFGGLGVLWLASCSSNPVTSTYLQDGSEAFMASCSGAGRTLANCEFEAGEECGAASR